MKIIAKYEAARFLEMHQVFNQVKNDLTEVGKIGDLSNAAVLGMIAEKLPSDPCKTRWIRY